MSRRSEGLGPSQRGEMTDHSLSRYEALAFQDQVVIDRLCSSYETALRTGENPVLEEFLQKVRVGERSCLLTELVAIDRVYRRGEGLSRDDYVARFPDFTAAIDVAFQSGSATRRGSRPQLPHRESGPPPAIAGYE